MDINQPLPSHIEGTPTFETSRAVRTGDIGADRRLRLDAIARYLQDVGSDNLDAWSDRFDEEDPLWIVRRTVIDVHRPATFPDRVRLTRWCSAFSTRWCNMRVRLEGDAGALIETEAFWIHISPATGMPSRIPEAYLESLVPHTAEQRLRWKRALADAPGDDADMRTHPFALRMTDVDLLDHVNNAVYWHGVEEHLAEHAELLKAPHRAVIEYLKPIAGGEDLALRVRHGDARLDIWFEVDGDVRAQARVHAL